MEGRAAPTRFAPAERASAGELEQVIQGIIDDPIIHAVLRAVEGFVVVLNGHRQALAVNEQALEALGLDASECVGLRPGEIMNCQHAQEGPGGCGTGSSCRSCGAVLTILSSQQSGRPATGECLLSRRNGQMVEACEFMVRCTPLSAGGQDVMAFVLRDISGQKRREVLERIFFHDLLNTLGGIRGYVHLLNQPGQAPLAGAGLEQLRRLTDRVVDDIKAHRLLLDAESGGLRVDCRPTLAADLLGGVRAVFQNHDAAQGRTLTTRAAAEGAMLNTDASILLRVLINMVKNALEAVPEGGEVVVWHQHGAQGHSFLVNNPGVIAPENRGLIFHRSFSTKAQHGRGLGTYGMKLLGEGYLGGRVGFVSNEAEGTTFFITLPG